MDVLPTAAADETPSSGTFVVADILLVDTTPKVYLVGPTEFTLLAQAVIDALAAALPQTVIFGVRHLGPYPSLPSRTVFRVEVPGDVEIGQVVADALDTILRSVAFINALREVFPPASQALARIVVDTPLAVVMPAVAGTEAPNAAAGDDDDGVPLVAIILGGIAGVLLLVGIAALFIMQTTASKEEVEFRKIAHDLEGGAALPPVRRTSAYFTTALDQGDVAERHPAQVGTRVFYTGTPATVSQIGCREYNRSGCTNDHVLPRSNFFLQ